MDQDASSTSLNPVSSSAATTGGGAAPSSSFSAASAVTADLEDFRVLTSTKQNVELFKILSAIAAEIEALKVSTERRFSALEGLVGQQAAANAAQAGPPPASTAVRAGSAGNRSDGGRSWDVVKMNRSYNHYRNMAG